MQRVREREKVCGRANKSRERYIQSESARETTTKRKRERALVSTRKIEIEIERKIKIHIEMRTLESIQHTMRPCTAMGASSRKSGVLAHPRARNAASFSNASDGCSRWARKGVDGDGRIRVTRVTHESGVSVW